MKRILVIGPCGSGKSTLARLLGKRLGLPVTHLDQLHWSSGWKEGSSDELLEALAPILGGERWIVDGNYGGTLAPRLARADTVVYLDFGIGLCLWRLVRRTFQHLGSERPDMPEGCPERFDPAFFWYVARWNAGPRPRTEARLKGHEEKVIRLSDPAALRAWLARLPHGSAGTS